MKKEKLLMHTPLLYLIYLILIQTFGTRWIANAIAIPFFAKAVAILAYVPCVASVLWLLWLDIKNLRQKKISLFSICYYLFAFYYLCITAFRFFDGGVVKDSVYYVIVLYGAISLAELIIRKVIPTTKEALRFDLCVNVILLCAYRFVWCIVRPFANNNVMPINEIAMGAVLLFSLVIVAGCLRNSANRTEKLLASVAITATVVVIMTLTSRIMFAVLCVECIALLVLFLLDKNNRKYVKHYLVLIGCGVLIVAVLAVANVGNVRYSLYRATAIPGLYQESAATQPDGDSSTGDTVDENEAQQDAQAQIERSDSLRKRLNEFGIQEVRKNILFGTGNVYMDIEDFGYPARVPVHNGILQMLVSFGLIGTLMLLAMVCLWLWGNRPNQVPILNNNMLGLLLLLMLYGVFAMVQATSFDHMVLPSVLLCSSVFLQRESKEL